MKRYFLIIGLFLIQACSSTSSVSLGDEDADADEIATGTQAIFFATDFQSSGQILTSDFTNPTTVTNERVTGLGSSAIIRFFDGLIYVLHDGFSTGSSDNVQIIAPDQDFRTIAQFSTGNGTNPHDIIVDGDRAFITLYSPELGGASSLNDQGQPTDVLVMDLTNGNDLGRLSFQNFLNADASKTARADQMVRAGNKIYVCVQDLEGNAFTHNAPGKIGIVNMDTLAVEGVITLQGRNPTDIVHSASDNKLYVALQAPFQGGNFDISAAFGGVEIIPLGNPTSTVLLADEDLGGYVERLATSSDQLVAVASQFDPVSFDFTSDIVVFPLDSETAAAAETFLDGVVDVRNFAVDGDDRLWITTRAIRSGAGQATSPAVKIFELESGDQVGATLFPSIPVTTIVFEE